MKKIINNLLGLLAVAVLLTACTSRPVYETVYSYQPPVGEQGKRCVSQCNQSKTLCKRLCNAESSDCVAQARLKAKKAYHSYLSEREARGLLADRTQDSFINSRACLSNRQCHCENDFKACVELCGGRAIPKRRCVANCGDVTNSREKRSSLFSRNTRHIGII